MKAVPVALSIVAAALVASGCTTPEPTPLAARIAQGVPGMGAGPLYQLARYLHGQQKYDDALRAYEQVLAREPGHVDALNAVGAIRSMRGESELAEKAFREAIAAAPGESRSYNNLGYHLLRTGRASEALTQLQVARSLAPRDEQVQVNIAMAHARIGPTPAVAAPPQPAEPPAEQLAPEPQPTVALQKVQEGIWELRNAPSPAPVLQASVPAPAAAPEPLAPAVEVATRAAAQKPVALEISNGNGRTGLAREVGQLLETRTRLTNTRPYGTLPSRIQYTAGYEDAARAIVSQLPVAVPLAQVARLDRANVKVLLGKDFPRQPAALMARGQRAPAPSQVAMQP